MTTMGQRILERLNDLETAVTEIQLNPPTRPTDGDPNLSDLPNGQIDELRRQFRIEVEEMKKQLLEAGPQFDGMRRDMKLWNPRDCMPDILSSDYKNRWRVWSYKARDWLGMLEDGLASKLEKIETMPSELSDDYVRSLSYPPKPI